jgi:glycosyltransferase involved in cell wall biosynthesis
MKQPLVSIIIPTYNRGALIENAIRSVLRQTYAHWQLVIVDDGSADDTQARVQPFCAAHPSKIAYYYQPNQGQAAARTAGLSHCQGEYIASLDSDDEWHADFLAVSVEQFVTRDLDLVFLNWVGTYDTEGFTNFYRQPAQQRAYCTTPAGDWWLLSPAQIRQLAIETCPSPSSALIIRRTALAGTWNQQMRIADDWCLLLDTVLSRPCRAAFTLKPHWLKHVHDTNIYDGRFDTALIRDIGLHDEPLMLERFGHQLQPHEKRLFRERIATHHFNFLCLNWANRPGLASTLEHAAQALRLAPWLTTQAFFERGMRQFKKRALRAQP